MAYETAVRTTVRSTARAARRLATAIVALGLGTAAANASILTLSLHNVTFSSNGNTGTVTGSFGYDTVTNAYSAISIHANAAGLVPATDFTTEDSVYGGADNAVVPVLTNAAGTIELILQTQFNLPTVGGIKDPLTYVLICEGHGGASCQVTADYLTSLDPSPSGEYIEAPAPADVPEPLTLSLLGAGLAGLWAARRRQKPA